MDSLRRLAAELSAADPHWNVEPLLRAADLLDIERDKPLTDELTALLARYWPDLRTNTPPDVLARHMVASLRQFEAALLDRANHPFFAPGKK